MKNVKQNKKPDKRFLVMALIVLAVILGILAFIFLRTPPKEQETEKASDSKTIVAENEYNGPSTDVETGSIPGFQTSEEDQGGYSEPDTNDSLPDETTQTEAITEAETILAGESNEVENGLQIPYSIPDTLLEIQQIGKYSGPFLEDGSDEPQTAVTAILVKNNSGKDTQYAEIVFKVNASETAEFTLSTIPAGASVLVMEKNKRPYSESDTYDFQEVAYVEMDSPDLLEDKIKVTGKNGILAVENLTEENLGMVYVRYKYFFTDGTYQGGITYETKFDSVGPNAVVEKDAPHYSADTSKILMVGYVPEE